MPEDALNDYIRVYIGYLQKFLKNHSEGYEDLPINTPPFQHLQQHLKKIGKRSLAKQMRELLIEVMNIT
jgi:hypothetical protein